MLKKRWVLKDDADKDVVEKLATSLKIDHTLARLLEQRGITTYSEARDYFRPSLDHLVDPFLMKDMAVAIDRIDQAIEKKERILVYGDYDVDGTTAVALVYDFLREFHSDIDYYIPDRYSEGYGISYESIDYAKSRGITLMISLDCGIKAHKQVEYARDRGIDFIVVDHHRPDDNPLVACAVVDPKQPDCNYPYKEFSGCGLGFKLAQAYCQKHKIPFKKLECLLDLVVVSIAADVVPITGENRILAHFGLKRLNLYPRAGFESILFYSNVYRKGEPDHQTVFTRPIGIGDLMFLIGPKINAAGRIEKGKKAVDLLVCAKMGETHELSEDINDNNTERRSLDTEITRQALMRISQSAELRGGLSTVLFDPDWHKGVIGIVASRLIEHYYRPTIILTASNGLITGSARSVKGFDVYNAIDACSDLLEDFGGHMYAAGLSLKPENLETFKQRFAQVVESTIAPEMLVPQIEVHAEIPLKIIQGKFFRVLKQFAPFGPGNPNPIFVSKDCHLSGMSRIVGNKHLKFKVSQTGYPQIDLPAIAFQQGHHQRKLQQKQPFDMAYQIEENEWNGQISLQLNVKDIRFPETEQY